jgi:hypothetical protein
MSNDKYTLFFEHSVVKGMLSNMAKSLCLHKKDFLRERRSVALPQVAFVQERVRWYHDPAEPALAPLAIAVL